MAMPANFWRDEQKLDIFKTKTCQRLASDGVCKWRSRCQYSHCPEWPRRQPRKYKYAPQICPTLNLTEDPVIANSTVKSCPDGLRCPFAHSKEEVLFHPLVFKTIMCDEYTKGIGEKSLGVKRKKCHRFYCPFAHGGSELRTSTLSVEEREACIRAASLFPSDNCCQLCTPYSESLSNSSCSQSVDSFCQEISEVRDGSDIDSASFVPYPSFPWMGHALQAPGLSRPYDSFIDLQPPGLASPYDSLFASVNTPLSPIGPNASLQSLQQAEGTFGLWGDAPAFVNLVGDAIVSIGPKEQTRERLTDRPIFQI